MTDISMLIQERNELIRTNKWATVFSMTETIARIERENALSQISIESQIEWLKKRDQLLFLAH